MRDNKGDNDAAIRILDPWWLNKRGVKEREVIPPGAEVGISTPDSDRYKPDEAALESLTGEPEAHITKVTIPRAEVPLIKEQLTVAGVDEVTIFPDRDGLGRYLNSVLQSEADAG